MWFCAPLLFLTIATCQAWHLQTNVNHVTPNKTKNVQLVCKQDDNAENDKDLETINGIRITKVDPLGNKMVFAEIHILSGKPSTIGKDVEVTASLNQNQGAFLTVKWQMANDETEGAYGCEIDGYDALDNHKTVHARPSVKINKKMLTETEVISLIGKMTQSYEKKQIELKGQIGAMRKYIDEILQSTKRLIRDKDDEMKAKLSKIQNSMEATYSTKNELKDQVADLKTVTMSRILAEKSQNRKRFDMLSSLIHTTSSTFEKRFSETSQILSNLKDQFNSSVESLRKRNKDVLSRLSSTANGLSNKIQIVDRKYELLLKNLTSDLTTKLSDLERKCPCSTTTTPKPIISEWPGGSYALVRPETGCANLKELEAMGRSLFKTVSYAETGFIPYSTYKTIPKDMKLIIKSESNEFELKYCVKDTSIPSLSSPLWPNGTYCIALIDGTCPRYFTLTYVRYIIQSLNDIKIIGRYKMSACCRTDGKPNVPIKLPKDVPFYLQRYNGTCQEVEGMTIKPHVLQLTTGVHERLSSKNQNEYADIVPGSWASYAMCYYQVS